MKPLMYSRRASWSAIYSEAWQSSDGITSKAVACQTKGMQTVEMRTSRDFGDFGARLHTVDIHVPLLHELPQLPQALGSRF